MLDEVQEQNRIKDQIAGIATLLQNPTNLEGLSRLFLNELAVLFEVPYSVLYYWKDNRLLRVAAYAADGEKNVRSAKSRLPRVRDLLDKVLSRSESCA
ncbi:hypothetical protein P9222_19640 [Paenibacillus amylolyticus]|nr:hypothetical protein [Paenibacillus amylolyticus]WFR60759.1 hypothetical protein P9222_19640 [Paenibacillus amylolyticus]